MLQSQIHSPEYWETGFTLTDSDLEQIFNLFLETEKPHTSQELARVIIEKRLREQVTELKRLMSDSTVYQPQGSYAVGDELVFPALKLARGKVTGVRPGFNPEHGAFNVITVNIKGKTREFAADLKTDHVLNGSDGAALLEQMAGNRESIMDAFAPAVAKKIRSALAERDDFVRLGSQWFVKSLMADINIGHLHLTEAILDMADGGPLSAAEILPQLELDAGIDPAVQSFSLNQAMAGDERFDQVSPTGEAAWFLRRMEPEGVRSTPERLVYDVINYDRAFLSPQQLVLEQELDDEWSNLPRQSSAGPVVVTLSFPHRWAGTLPLNARTSALFAMEGPARMRVLFVDDETGQEIVGWVVPEGRYIYGLSEWYKENAMPVGGFIHLAPGAKPGTFSLGYDRRRSQREWVRLASLKDNRLVFELQRRSIQSGYDELLIVGTDVVAAVDAHWKKVTASRRGIASLLAEIFPSLASLSPQNTVHAKTLYSAVNMLRRLPPGPIFAELVRHPAFRSVGDHYWQFDSDIWRE